MIRCVFEFCVIYWVLINSEFEIFNFESNFNFEYFKINYLKLILNSEF
jgi:hypothetical protein